MKGIYSALLVSFDKEGNINEKGLRQIIRHNIDNCKVYTLEEVLEKTLCFQLTRRKKYLK